MFRDCFMNHRVVGYREDNVAAVARRGVVTCFPSKIEVPTQTPLSTVSSGRIWHTVDWWNDGLKRFAAPLMTQQWFTLCLMSCQQSGQLHPSLANWQLNSWCKVKLSPACSRQRVGSPSWFNNHWPYCMEVDEKSCLVVWRIMDIPSTSPPPIHFQLYPYACFFCSQMS